ncbi:alpha/beta fold hydrolase [Reichenbachiella sp.]|uniref:alpha/beta fold hydrolase n=1 Tax=Reichenbachiella sp. TaxID=2184521 RepID=UPI003BAEAEB6
MNHSPQLYTYSSSIQLEYALFGKGVKKLVCFHGFGQNLMVFNDLSTKLDDHQIVSINLLFHGKSRRQEGPKYLHQNEWKDIFDGFLNHLKINHFSVLGYSLGGRYTASTLKSFENRIDHCILIAPDGIVKRSSYEFATFPLGSEQLFGFFMKNPKPFFIFLSLIEKTKLFNQWTIDFSRAQLQDEEQRMRVYHSWITLRKFRMRQLELIKRINAGNFQSTVIFGKYDKIIQPKRHFYFLNQIPKAKVIILDTGHTKLLNESFAEVSDVLNKSKSL